MGATKEMVIDMANGEGTVPSPAKKSIYNIQNDHLMLMCQIEDLEGEITPEIEEQLALTEKEFEEKAVSYGYVIRQYDFEINQINDEIARLSAIALRKAKIKDDIKGRIHEAMLRFNIEKIEKNNLKLSFRKSKQLIIDEGAVIPSNYITIKEVESVDKKALKEAIEEGSVFKGIYVFENKNLQIK